MASPFHQILHRDAIFPHVENTSLQAGSGVSVALKGPREGAPSQKGHRFSFAFLKVIDFRKWILLCA